jgi:hypothetical protein
MELGRVLSVPYQLVRRPLDLVDRHAIAKLPPGSPIRHAYRGALQAADTVMSLVGNRPPSTKPDAEDPVRPAAKETSSEPVSQSEEQRREAFAHKTADITRGNRSPATMNRDLARMHAVVQAREEQETT